MMVVPTVRWEEPYVSSPKGGQICYRLWMRK